jgi:hypothetical protein
MEFDPQDQEIIRLLTKLKDVDEQYPESLLVARRRSYLKRMTEISLGISGDTNVRNPVKSPRAASLSPHTSTFLETVLIVAIVAEAGLAAYFYRDQLSDFFQTLGTSSNVEEVPPPARDPVPPEAQEVSPATRSTAIPEDTLGITVTPTGTPVPGRQDQTPAIDPLSTTPVSPEDKGNNGNHYGQTPKPERTKEKNGNNDKPPKNEEDKPPKEKEPKPTKDK